MTFNTATTGARRAMTNRKLSSPEKKIINSAARQATGTRFTFCEVGLKSLPGDGDRSTFNDALCIHLGGDLYDNCNALADFRLDFENGLLDIYCYTYETIAQLKDGDVELFTNVTVRIENGRAISAWEEGKSTPEQMAMYDQAMEEAAAAEDDKKGGPRADDLAEPTRVEGFWGAMIPTSYGKIIKRENGKITIKWDDDDALFYALEKDLRAKGDDQVSPIGVFIT